MEKIPSYADYLNTIKNGRFIIEFSSNDCPPCKALKPVLSEIEIEIPEIKIYEVNITEAKDISNKLVIFSVPTLIFIQNGNELKRLIGYSNKKKILKTIKGVFK